MKLAHKDRILKDIEGLRLKHSCYFNAQEWLKMQTISGKIRKLYEIYHSVKEKEENESAGKRLFDNYKVMF